MVTADPSQDIGNGRILIVEDHTMLAQALALGLSLSGHGFDCRIAELAGPKSVVEQANEFRPYLVLLDLDLGLLDGLDLVRALRGSGARVLVVTGSHDERRLAATLSLGTEGWVNKDEPFEQLIDRALLVMSGRALMSPRRLSELASVGRKHLTNLGEGRARLDRLTPREREVLAALDRGGSAQELATDLFLSIATVRSHIRSILTKLEVPSQLAAVAMARRYGLSSGEQASPAA